MKHVTERSKQGFVARATETQGLEIDGCCCCITRTQKDDVWFEQEAAGEVEHHQEIITVGFETTWDCGIGSKTLPLIEDIQAMAGKT